MNTSSFFLLVGIITIPFGCTLAPKYTRPDAPIPNGRAGIVETELTQSDKPGIEATKVPTLPWQSFFADAKLQKVIALALENNRDLRLAALNVDRARALYGIQRAELMPTLDLTGSENRQRVPSDLSTSGSRQITNRYDAKVGVAAWEIDFFGRIQSLKDSALNAYMATEEARRSAQILLISSVANTYMTLAADADNRALAQQTLENLHTTQTMIQRNLERGLISATEVQRTITQVEAQRGIVARLSQQVAQDENALQLLLGTPLPVELQPISLENITAPKSITSNIPAEVLLNRPDVLESEDQLKAAQANIGAARAAFFPRISLTSSIGTASSELSGLFGSGSSAWTFSPQIVLPLFDARTWSAYKVTQAQQQIAVAQYEKTIQSAFREVADTLALRSGISAQLEAQQALFRAVTQTMDLSVSRYKKGIDSYLNVLEAQRASQVAKQGLISLQLATDIANTRLYAVLGGGASGEPSTKQSIQITLPQ
jgi:multidrug efflux system outer membrane protein